MKQVECNKCGKHFEVEEHEEWGYCPFCENDQVEVYKNQLLNVQMVSAKEITKLHKELALTEKALELACELVLEFIGNCPYDHFNLTMPSDCEEQCAEQMKRYYCWDKYFKTKAKEMLDET